MKNITKKYKKKSLLKHWVEKNVILSFNSTNLLCVGSLNTKRTVSGISNRFYLSWVLGSCSEALVLLKLFDERVWTALRLSWKTESFELTPNSRIWWSGPLLCSRFLCVFSAFSFCLRIFIWNPLVCSCFLEKWAYLHFDVRNAGCLSGVVVIKKIVSFHKLSLV